MPPTESISRAMASAEPSSVPLKTMCSMKWGRPFSSGCSAARAVADPHAHGDRADVGHGLGEHHQAVGQDMLLNVARFGGHPKIVTQARRKEKTIGGVLSWLSSCCGESPVGAQHFCA